MQYAGLYEFFNIIIVPILGFGAIILSIYQYHKIEYLEITIDIERDMAQELLAQRCSCMTKEES